MVLKWIEEEGLKNEYDEVAKQGFDYPPKKIYKLLIKMDRNPEKVIQRLKLKDFEKKLN